MKKSCHIRNCMCAALTVLSVLACSKEVKQTFRNVYNIKSSVTSNAEEDSPVILTLDLEDAGLTPDNASWGDPWAWCQFYSSVTNEGKQNEDVMFIYEGKALRDGDRIELGNKRKLMMTLTGLRKGDYVIMVNLRTRYGVDTWTSVRASVGDGSPAVVPPVHVKVTDIVTPAEDASVTKDVSGRVKLVTGAAEPFRYTCRILPDDATDRVLTATSDKPAVVEAAIVQDSVLVLSPKSPGVAKITVASSQGEYSESFYVTVEDSVPDPDGFTLPIDEPAYEKDPSGRLVLDINTYNGGNPFRYHVTMRPYGAKKKELIASSNNPPVLKAAIEGDNDLVLTPVSVGYATVTVKTTDGELVRTMDVAVVSNVVVVLSYSESTPTSDDLDKGIWPCKVSFKANSTYTPAGLMFDVKASIKGGIELTDGADIFLREELKYQRNIYKTLEDDTTILYLSSGNAAYNIKTRLMDKIVQYREEVHHTADWPNYYDWTAYYRMMNIRLNFTVKTSEFDANLYRITFRSDYDDPQYKIYPYLHAN